MNIDSPTTGAEYTARSATTDVLNAARAYAEALTDFDTATRAYIVTGDDIDDDASYEAREAALASALQLSVVLERWEIPHHSSWGAYGSEFGDWDVTFGEAPGGISLLSAYVHGAVGTWVQVAADEPAIRYHVTLAVTGDADGVEKAAARYATASLRTLSKQGPRDQSSEALRELAEARIEFVSMVTDRQRRRSLLWGALRHLGPRNT